MTKEQRALLLDRLENCLNCMKNQNSGADIHTVGNIRHSASGLERLIEERYDIGYPEANEWCKRIEKSVVEFYKKKYSQHFAKP